MHPAPVMKRGLTEPPFPLLLSLALLPFLTSACSSSKAYVTARSQPQSSFTPASRIAVAPHAAPRREEQVLQQALQLELSRQGFQVVPADQADFILTYWIEEAWKPGKQVIYPVDDWPASLPPPLPPILAGAPAGIAYSPHYEPAPRIVDAPFNVQGIRLKLFPAHGTGADQLRPAWEGYIEGGAIVRAKREAVLLRTLFQYFGRNFEGRARFAD